MNYTKYVENPNSFFHIAEICRLKDQYENAIEYVPVPAQRQSLTLANAEWYTTRTAKLKQPNAIKYNKEILNICEKYMNYTTSEKE